MNFLSASVKIAVDDTRLPAQLAKAKSAVTRTVKAIRGAFGKMATSFKAAFDKIARYAKWAVIALVGIGAASVKMAMDVQDSEDFFSMAMGKMEASTRKWSNELSDALNLNRSEVRETVAIFNEMTTAMGMEDAAAAKLSQRYTKLAYDLLSYHPKVKTLEQASTVLQAALTGERETLKRLGYYYSENDVKLKAIAMGYGANINALTALQKLEVNDAILMEKMVNVHGDLDRTIGQSKNVFRSFWNILKETAIGIGNKLMPAVTDVGIKMRDWLNENKEQVIEWAGVWATKIESVIKKLWDFIKFMRTDWKKGIEYGLRVSKELFIGFGETIYAIFEHTFFRLANSVGSWTSQILEEIIVREKAYGEKFRELVPWYSLGSREEAKKEAEAYAEAEVQIYRKVKEQLRALELKDEESLNGKIVKLHQDMMNRIAKIPRPEGYLKPPEEPGVEPVWFDWQKPFEMPEMPEMPGIGKKRPVDTDTVAKAAKEAAIIRTEAMRAMYGEMGKMTQGSYDAQLDILNKLSEEYKQAGVDRLEIDQWYLEQKQQIDIELLKSSDSVIDGFEAAGMEMKRDMKTWGEVAAETAGRIHEEFAGALAATIVRGQDFKEAMRQMALDVIEDLIKVQIMNAIAGGWSGLFGGSQPTISAGVRPARTVLGSRQTGGDINQTGLYQLHKGETVTPAGGSSIDIRVHNEDSENLVVSRTESYMMSDKRILDVVLKAKESNGPFRRGMR